jgi:hypothetical protein
VIGFDRGYVEAIA